MAEGQHNPWKLTTIGLLLVFATALITALVMANWGGNDKPQAPRASTGGAVRPAVIPTVADIEVCNAKAKTQVGDKTTEVLKDALIGGAVGAGVGAAGGAIAGGGKTLYGLNEANKNDVRYQEAYRQCMRGRGYTG
ncbi:MAG: hypothetical protein HYW16_03835 [Candidatus Rokubacteria bacterium]|nr:hypothetical protein [Candidatus Rokubacteria bacterium]